MYLVLTKDIIKDKTVSRLIGTAGFALLTALGAFVRIPLPFSPVPITLQTFFVLLSGALLGGTLGPSSQLLYLLLGLAGLPIFTGAGSGLLYLCGPTSGYLFGFVLASLFIGRSIKNIPQNFISVFMLLFSADLILLSFGTMWLRLVLGFSWPKLFLMGFLPFIPGDIIKALACTLIYSRLYTHSRQIF
jgi:biotin transport system substrate-specific component